jgi:hypothetical protein
MVVVVVVSPVICIAAVAEVTEVTDTTPEACMAYEPGMTTGAPQAASTAYEAASATSKAASSRVSCPLDYGFIWYQIPLETNNRM